MIFLSPSCAGVISPDTCSSLFTCQTKLYCLFILSQYKMVNFLFPVWVVGSMVLRIHCHAPNLITKTELYQSTSVVGQTRATRYMRYRVEPLLVVSVWIDQLSYCSTCSLMSLMQARKLLTPKRLFASAAVRPLPLAR